MAGRGAGRARVLAAGLALAIAGAGCRQDMHDQPRYKPYAKTDFFGDGRSARPLVAGTIARGMLREDTVFFTGKQGGQFVEALPFPLTEAVLRRGQQRFGIYCAPCHGQTGQGDGMVVRRGFRRPTSFHVDRLRGERVGYLFDVMTNGFGVMPDYAAQVPPADRWAIAAFVKVLQLSQHADVKQLPAELVARIGQPAAEAGASGEPHK
ncbi:MAG: cytochrome c [Vicinamibacteria bacterium]